MNYKENIKTGEVIEDNGHLGSSYRKAPWKDSTKQKFDNFEKLKDLKIKKVRKKEELRWKHIDNLIKTQLEAVDNAESEEELDNIN